MRQRERRQSTTWHTALCGMAVLPQCQGPLGELPVTPPGVPSLLCHPSQNTMPAEASGNVLLLSCHGAPTPKSRVLSSPAPTAALHSSAGRAPDVFLYVSGLNLFICWARAACTVLPLLPTHFCHLFLLWEFMAQNTSDITVSVSFLCCSYGCCAAL